MLSLSNMQQTTHQLKQKKMYINNYCNLAKKLKIQDAILKQHNFEIDTKPSNINPIEKRK